MSGICAILHWYMTSFLLHWAKYCIFGTVPQNAIFRRAHRRAFPPFMDRTTSSPSCERWPSRPNYHQGVLLTWCVSKTICFAYLTNQNDTVFTWAMGVKQNVQILTCLKTKCWTLWFLIFRVSRTARQAQLTRYIKHHFKQCHFCCSAMKLLNLRKPHMQISKKCIFQYGCDVWEFQWFTGSTMKSPALFRLVSIKFSPAPWFADCLQ